MSSERDNKVSKTERPSESVATVLAPVWESQRGNLH